MSWSWRPYVSVAERRAMAQKKMSKLRKQGVNVQPVIIEGRKIVSTFWGESWCKHLESFSDYENRLPRGRTYVRNGSVCHLVIEGGEINAKVSGSSLYDVKIAIKKIAQEKWKELKEKCAGQIGSLLDLLKGRLSNNIMSVVTDKQQGLFPLPGEMNLDCSCPDWADMCKHVAAVLYGVGARLDEKPELLFHLRGVDHEELITAEFAVTSLVEKQGSRKRMAVGDLQDIFGIDLFENNQFTNDIQNGRKMSNTTSGANKEKLENGNVRNENKRVKKENNLIVTGLTVQNLRARLDISQQELAKLVGASATSVARWEKRNRHLATIKRQSMQSLKELLNLSKEDVRRRLQGL